MPARPIAIALAVAIAGSALAAVSARPAPAATSLSPKEAKALAYMREEEKLARDVYRALAAKWSLPVFRNIARSEQQHMNAVGVLLERYGVADPAAGNPAGVFENAKLQALYAKLVAKGRQSLSAALRVGVRIERLDIADLRARLAVTSASDVKFVFTRLLQGSQRHLAAFSR